MTEYCRLHDTGNIGPYACPSWAAFLEEQESNEEEDAKQDNGGEGGGDDRSDDVGKAALDEPVKDDESYD